MPGTQLINNGVTSGGLSTVALDLSSGADHFIKGQELEQDRRRSIIQRNEAAFTATDLSKLSQADLDGGIKQKYTEYQKLGMNPGKDFNKHDAEMRAAHQSMENDIKTAMNVRKANMAMYDDLKPLLPPEELIKLQEDIKKPSINPDGSQNLLNPSSYKLKPKDYLSVNKLVYDGIQKNTGKDEVLQEVKRKDGKYVKTTGARVNVKNTIDNLLEDYQNDTKVRESIDNAVAHLNSSSSAPGLTVPQYIKSQVEAEVLAKQSSTMKDVYANGVFKPGGETAIVNVNTNTPNEYVSHTTVKVDAGQKSADQALKLYESAYDSLNRFVYGKGNGEDAAAKATKIIKGGTVDGGVISGVEPIINSSGEKGLKVYFSDQYEGKMVDPKEYYGRDALRRLGLYHNQRQKSVMSQVVPDPALTSEKRIEYLKPAFPKSMQLSGKPKEIKATPTAKKPTVSKSAKASTTTLSFFK